MIVLKELLEDISNDQTVDICCGIDENNTLRTPKTIFYGKEMMLNLIDENTKLRSQFLKEKRRRIAAELDLIDYVDQIKELKKKIKKLKAKD